MSLRFDYRLASPVGVRALRSVYEHVRASLPQQLVDLVFLRVSQINGCAYCIDLHSRDLLENGLPIDHLILVPVWRESGAIFSARERAALEWAEIVTSLGEGGVPENAFRFAAETFEERELVDLTIAIGLMNAYNRLAISFRVTPKATGSTDAACAGEEQ